MPRSGGGRSGGGRSAPARAPSRPQAPAPPPRSVAPQQQQRPMSTTAAQGKAPPAQTQSPGLFGQMASTAAGVAVGSSIGHAIGGFFGGGSSSQSEQAPEQSYQQAGTTDAYAQPMDSGLYNAQSQSQMQSQAQGPCATDIQSFTRCMEGNKGDMNICGWYLDQLKACQQAAKQY